MAADLVEEFVDLAMGGESRDAVRGAEMFYDI